MPSVLAISDLRRRIRRHLARRSSEEADLAVLLALDPPAICRGLRVASAPIYERPSGRWTVRRLVQVLGRATSFRLAFPTERGAMQAESIRRLWMRSVATACAARRDAEDRDVMPPDEAYLFGLLRALPSWLKLLDSLRTGRQGDGPPPRLWTDRWNLPPELAAATGVGDPTNCDGQILAMLERAELAADQAGLMFAPGGPFGAAAPALTSDTATTLLAEEVHADVQGLLCQVGLEPEPPGPDLHGRKSVDAAVGKFGGAARSPFDELTLTLLGYSGAATYRDLITALVSAGIRHGGFDRAFYARWCNADGAFVLRAKSDLSSRPLAQTRLAPTKAEERAMRAALAEDRPLRLEGTRDGDGVLAALSVDEALLVPLNRGLQTPSFLVLDRSLSLEPIRIAADGSRALTMGLAGTLLVENLLLRRRRDRAHKSAQIDGLTHLYNRTTGVRILDQELARAERGGESVAVLLCDLDHFKVLNDSLGHLIGDEALRVVAETLRQTVRRSDSICRYGGEEFLVILPDTSEANAAVLAARLHTTIEDQGNQLGIPLTISIGLAMSTLGDTWESVVLRADQALYASKDRGRNRFAIGLTPEPSVDEPALSGPGPSQGPG